MPLILNLLKDRRDSGVVRPRAAERRYDLPLFSRLQCGFDFDDNLGAFRNLDLFGKANHSLYYFARYREYHRILLSQHISYTAFPNESSIHEQKAAFSNDTAHTATRSIIAIIIP